MFNIILWQFKKPSLGSKYYCKMSTHIVYTSLAFNTPGFNINAKHSHHDTYRIHNEKILLQLVLALCNFPALKKKDH